MSKQDRIIQILVTNEINDGIIEQSLYDFIVETISEEYKLKKQQAKQTVTHTLRGLYVTAV